ncbi:hypothetical protein X798_00162 [Onchocerca flexuosa]|uniref:Uncharacterized protein n=2 Tax=Onchocerca flexuosa TaxID=387005 RepID=A0A183H4S2_9BILA|nr:hypothetical protein X798_00162 [Onchocerca flexuosa]VDO33141.1 unnamed protein product [Onchocerca flexuosa]
MDALMSSDMKTTKDRRRKDGLPHSSGGRHKVLPINSYGFDEWFCVSASSIIKLFPNTTTTTDENASSQKVPELFGEEKEAAE